MYLVTLILSITFNKKIGNSHCREREPLNQLSDDWRTVQYLLCVLQVSCTVRSYRCRWVRVSHWRNWRTQRRSWPKWRLSCWGQSTSWMRRTRRSTTTASSAATSQNTSSTPYMWVTAQLSVLFLGGRQLGFLSHINTSIL